MKGHLHPLTIITDEIAEIAGKLGFEIIFGPEIETVENNFDLLNIPPNHPARDEHDTFYFKNGHLLRTHTSPMQIRAMKERKPPVRFLVPGRTFRNEATDATHSYLFHQVEGLVIDKDINIGHLFYTLEKIFQGLFGKNCKLRFRSGYFPFVEPGIEFDINYSNKDQFLEIGGAGLVHPIVMGNFGLDPNKWSGFAFGFGLDRLVSLKYGLNDIRELTNPDYRLFGQM